MARRGYRMLSRELDRPGWVPNNVLLTVDLRIQRRRSESEIGAGSFRRRVGGYALTVQ